MNTEKTDTRTTLLRIGLELFSKSSYEAVGVQDIVNRASVTKPTLYHYFGSKLGFYQAVFDTYVLPFRALLLEKLKYERDLTNNLNQIAVFTLEYFREHPLVYWLMERAVCLSEASEIAAYSKNHWDVINQAVVALFKQAVDMYGNMKGKEELTGTLFVHCVRAQVFVVLTGRCEYSEKLPYDVVRQFMYGIG